MCGISVLVNLGEDKLDGTLIENMNERIVHRGPNDHGVFLDRNLGLGHRRLSILDISQAGHQPMHYHGCWIIFNGEVYNYIELREELKALGFGFQSQTDTEVILAAYKAWGTQAFERFNGMWAFAIYDVEARKLFLCRDHFGIKPLYYGKTKDYFFAGSEIKQFLEVPDFRPELNEETAARFLGKGLLNFNQDTFFRNVHELAPGTHMEYNLENHHFSLHQWFNIDNVAPRKAESKEEIAAKVRELLNDSIRLRMRSDVPVGSCLSGGLDSSSIVTSIYSEKLAGPGFKTVTCCYEDKNYDEQVYSDQITAQNGFPSSKIFPDPADLFDLDEMGKIIYHQDQPILSPSHYNEYKVFEQASREGLVVMQDGQGSDEYFGGYGEFFVTYIRSAILNFRWGSALKELRKRASINDISFFALVKQVLRSILINPVKRRLSKLVGKETKEERWLGTDWKKQACRGIKGLRPASIRELSALQLQRTSLPYQLHSEDRNSMIFSIESRLPFLDPRLVSYVFSLPDDVKIEGGYNKLLIRLAYPDMPEQVRWRKRKMGFESPTDTYLRSNAAHIYKNLELLVKKYKIGTEALLVDFKAFAEGKAKHDAFFFRAYTFVRFLEIFRIQHHPEHS